MVQFQIVCVVMIRPFCLIILPTFVSDPCLSFWTVAGLSLPLLDLIVDLAEPHSNQQASKVCFYLTSSVFRLCFWVLILCFTEASDSLCDTIQTHWFPDLPESWGLSCLSYICHGSCIQGCFLTSKLSHHNTLDSLFSGCNIFRAYKCVD